MRAVSWATGEALYAKTQQMYSVAQLPVGIGSAWHQTFHILQVNVGKCVGKCWQGLRISLVNVDLFEKMKYSSLLEIKLHLPRKCVDLANIYQHIYQHLPAKRGRFSAKQDR